MLTQRQVCPVCRSSGSEPLLQLPFDADPLRSYLTTFYEGKLDPDHLAGEEYCLVRCSDCRLIYQRWVPDERSIERLYDEVLGWDREAVAESRGLDVRLRYLHDQERAIRYVGRSPSSTEVLDLGAGAGLWLDLASALGCRTSAVELNAKAAERIRGDGHVVYELAGLPAERFDLINAEQVFEHLVEPRDVALLLADALRPGGILRISVPNGGSVLRSLEHPDWSAPKSSPSSLNAVAPLEHINCFDHASLTRLGREVGLTPFVFPLRTEVHAEARIRYALASIKHRLRGMGGTLLFFAKR